MPCELGMAAVDVGAGLRIGELGTFVVAVCGAVLTIGLLGTAGDGLLGVGELINAPGN